MHNICLYLTNFRPILSVTFSPSSYSIQTATDTVLTNVFFAHIMDPRPVDRKNGEWVVIKPRHENQKM